MWLYFDFESDSWELIALLGFIENSIRAAHDEEQAALARFVNANPELLQESRWVGFIARHEPERIRRTFEEFRRLLLYGFIGTVCSIVETRLVELCKAVARLDKLQEPAPPRRGVLEWAKEYMKDSLSLQVPSGQAWEAIMGLKNIRNAIVHEDGRMTRVLDQYAKRHQEHLELGEADRLNIRPAYGEYIVKKIVAFFEELRSLNEGSFEKVPVRPA